MVFTYDFKHDKCTYMAQNSAMEASYTIYKNDYWPDKAQIQSPC